MCIQNTVGFNGMYKVMHKRIEHILQMCRLSILPAWQLWTVIELITNRLDNSLNIYKLFHQQNIL